MTSDMRSVPDQKKIKTVISTISILGAHRAPEIARHKTFSLETANQLRTRVFKMDDVRARDPEI